MSNHTRLNSLEKAQAMLNARGFGVQVKLDQPVRLEHTFTYPGVDLARYPHECPRCGAPAYIGLSTVECSDGCERTECPDDCECRYGRDS